MILVKFKNKAQNIAIKARNSQILHNKNLPEFKLKIFHFSSISHPPKQSPTVTIKFKFTSFTHNNLWKKITVVIARKFSLQKPHLKLSHLKIPHYLHRVMSTSISILYNCNCMILQHIKMLKHLSRSMRLEYCWKIRIRNQNFQHNQRPEGVEWQEDLGCGFSRISNLEPKISDNAGL